MLLAKTFMPLFGPLGWISLMLLLGVLLRAKIKIFQTLLFPASLIGGVIGFILINAGWVAVTHETFTVIALHLFTIGFISIGLTGTDAKTNDSTSRKVIFRGGLWMALIFIICSNIQTVTGMGILFGLNKVLPPIWEGVGTLLGVGFTQGPGQAVNLASVWQSAYKIPNAVSIGLTFAAVGFFVAAAFGVPLANWGLKKGLAANASGEIANDFRVGIANKDEGLEAGKQTMHASNIDTFAFQLAIILGIYLLTFFEAGLFEMVLPKVIKPMGYGMTFFLGMINGMIVRVILSRLKISHIIDNNVQRRLTGTTVDFMIVATMMAVKIATVWIYIIPITLMCVVAAVLTFYFITYFGKRNGSYPLERSLAMLGYCTGTAATGLLLLRIVDPQFKTPVALEMGLMNIFAIPFGLHMLFVGYPLPVFGALTGFMVHFATMVVLIVLLKVFKFWNKPAW